MIKFKTTCVALLLCMAAFDSVFAADASVQLVRNATLLIDYGGKKILLDPMFADKGEFGSWSGEGVTPSVELSMSIDEITKDLDFVLVTHAHIDHFDDKAAKALDKTLPIYGHEADYQFFLHKDFWNAESLMDSVKIDNITIYRTNAQHGTGSMLKKMGQGSGYILTAPGEPTLYIIGDAVWTQEIYDNIQRFKPAYIVVNSGGAIMPGGYNATPIIMDEHQVMSLVQESGNTPVIAVHMDAVDHCKTSRDILRKEAKKFNVPASKLIIPKDGEIIMLTD